MAGGTAPLSQSQGFVRSEVAKFLKVLMLLDEVCLSQWRFRVRLGPMDFETYRSLLPETDAFNVLSSAIRLATGPEYDFELTLVLDRNQVPPLCLLREGASLETELARLGWSTWLGQEERDRDPDDGVFTPSLAREEARDSMEMYS